MARPKTCRARVMEYIASRGGELRADSGVGIRRQIADALGERPTTIGQALLGLERGGLIERELDILRHRCHAIRLVPPGEEQAPGPNRPHRERRSDPGRWGPDHEAELITRDLRADRDRLERRLKEAEQELGVALRRGAELARRIEDLESRLEVARPGVPLLGGDEEVRPSLLVTLEPELWWAAVAGVDGGGRGRASEAR